MSPQVFITPQCYKITRQYLPGRRKVAKGALHPTLLPGQAPSVFKPSQATPRLPFLSLPSLPPCVRSPKAAADRHRKPIARGVPAGTLSRGPSCVFLPFVHALPRLASRPLFLSLLVSAFQPSQAKYVTKSAEKKHPPPLCSQIHLLWVSRFSLFRFSPDP